MKKFAIYSALVGDYDTILQPAVVDEEFDYFIFSNDIHTDKVGVWNILPIDYINSDPVKIARWVKTHPDKLLPTYEATLWIDANIQINSSALYSRFHELHSNPQTLVSAIMHPRFDCIYKEMFYLILNHYEHENVILDWGHKLSKDNYPRNNGTTETGLLYRRQCDQTASMNKTWWDAIEQFSRRDQLSFYYALWKSKITNRAFFDDGTTVRNNDAVKYYNHHISSGKYIIWKKDEAWLCRYAERNPNKTKKIEDLYYWIYSTSHPHFWAKTWGLIYRVMDVFHRVFK